MTDLVLLQRNSHFFNLGLIKTSSPEKRIYHQ